MKLSTVLMGIGFVTLALAYIVAIYQGTFIRDISTITPEEIRASVMVGTGTTFNLSMPLFLTSVFGFILGLIYLRCEK